MLDGDLDPTQEEALMSQPTYVFACLCWQMWLPRTRSICHHKD